MSLLQVRGIAKSFGSRLILDALDFDIEQGVRMGVIGPNGGGKSTLLRILAGEETADAGELTQRRGLTVAFLPLALYMGMTGVMPPVFGPFYLNSIGITDPTTIALPCSSPSGRKGTALIRIQRSDESCPRYRKSTPGAACSPRSARAPG